MDATERWLMELSAQLTVTKCMVEQTIRVILPTLPPSVADELLTRLRGAASSTPLQQEVPPHLREQIEWGSARQAEIWATSLKRILDPEG